MARVIVDISPSLDGFVAGHGVSVDRPFGDAGHRLHRWLGFEGTTPEAVDEHEAGQMLATAGAVVIGRRMFDVGIGLWGEDGAFGMPCFVVTHRPQAALVRGPTTFTFVTDGVVAALEQALAAAAGKDVVVAGGAQLVQQCLAAGRVDELRLHVVPVLLGAGVRLFDAAAPGRELRLARQVASANALHQTFELVA